MFLLEVACESSSGLSFEAAVARITSLPINQKSVVTRRAATRPFTSMFRHRNAASKAFRVKMVVKKGGAGGYFVLTKTRIEN